MAFLETLKEVFVPGYAAEKRARIRAQRQREQEAAEEARRQRIENQVQAKIQEAADQTEANRTQALKDARLSEYIRGYVDGTGRILYYTVLVKRKPRSDLVDTQKGSTEENFSVDEKQLRSRMQQAQTSKKGQEELDFCLETLNASSFHPYNKYWKETPSTPRDRLKYEQEERRLKRMRLNAIELLVENGANPMHLDQFKRSYFEKVCIQRDYDEARIMLKSPKFDSRVLEPENTFRWLTNGRSEYDAETGTCPAKELAMDLLSLGFGTDRIKDEKGKKVYQSKDKNISDFVTEAYAEIEKEVSQGIDRKQRILNVRKHYSQTATASRAQTVR